ncbi:Protein of unknown function [Gryllus bimaculatus]|nr:Protein of unknown function [Gryllus bimaculatus]
MRASTITARMRLQTCPLREEVGGALGHPGAVRARAGSPPPALREERCRSRRGRRLDATVVLTPSPGDPQAHPHQAPASDAAPSRPRPRPRLRVVRGVARAAQRRTLHLGSPPPPTAPASPTPTRDTLPSGPPPTRRSAQLPAAPDQTTTLDRQDHLDRTVRLEGHTTTLDRTFGWRPPPPRPTFRLEAHTPPSRTFGWDTTTSTLRSTGSNHPARPDDRPRYRAPRRESPWPYLPSRRAHAAQRPRDLGPFSRRAAQPPAPRTRRLLQDAPCPRRSAAAATPAAGGRPRAARPGRKPPPEPQRSSPRTATVPTPAAAAPAGRLSAEQRVRFHE